MGNRTRGRALALQYLYMLDILGGKTHRPATEFLDYWVEGGCDGEAKEFATHLIALAMACRDEADSEVAAISRNWKVERMAVVDRNIIRLAFAELKYDKETPYKVVLDEAIELAREFSTEESGAFVNGILDKVRERLRPETIAASGAVAADPAAPNDGGAIGGPTAADYGGAGVPCRGRSERTHARPSALPGDVSRPETGDSGADVTVPAARDAEPSGR